MGSEHHCGVPTAPLQEMETLLTDSNATDCYKLSYGGQEEEREWRRIIEREKIGAFPDQVVDTMKKSSDLPPPSSSSSSSSSSSILALERAVGNSFFKVMIGNYEEIMDWVLEMANKLCDKLLNGKDRLRDIIGIALRAIVSEIGTPSLAQRIQDSLVSQLIMGITNPYIPPLFAQSVGFLKNRNVYLGDSSGHTWRVKVAEVDGCLAFQEGWKKFVLYRSITVGEFVIFKYLGGSLFRARIYGKHACDRTFLYKKKVKKNPRPAHESYHFFPKQATPILIHDQKQKAPLPSHECSHSHKKQKTSEAVKGRCIPSHGAIANKLRDARVHKKAYVSTNNMTYYGRKRPNTDVPTKTAEVSKDQPISVNGEKKKIASVEMSGAGIPEFRRPRGRPKKALHTTNEPKSYRNVNEATNPEPLEANFCSAQKPINMESTKTSVKCLDSETKKMAKADVSQEQEVIASEKLSKSTDASKICSESDKEDLTEPNQSQKILVTEDGECHLEEETVLELPPIECLETRKEARKKRHTAKQEKIRSTNVETDRNSPKKRVCTNLLRSADHVGCVSQRKSPRLGSVSFGYNEEKKTTSKQKAIVILDTEGIVSCDALSTVPTNISFFITSPAQSSWIVLPEKLSCQLGRMKSNKKVIILQDSSMNAWPVVYHYSAKFIGFVGGWEDFMTANHLREGDLCELEPIEGPEYMFQVHVHKTTPIGPVMV